MKIIIKNQNWAGVGQENFPGIKEGEYGHIRQKKRVEQLSQGFLLPVLFMHALLGAGR